MRRLTTDIQAVPYECSLKINHITFTKAQKAYMVFKRFADIVIALIALTLLAVPLLLVCVIQKILSPSEPILFRQKRVGRDYKVFVIYKFRSMKTGAPNVASADLTNSANYIPKFGRFLRDTSIDELPQLLNVLKGDMSIIGPRPLIWQERDIRKLRRQNDVFAVRPGITGLAQINGRDLLDNQSKVNIDRKYIENLGLLMDIRVLLKSVVVVFSRIGIQEGTNKNKSADNEE